MLAEKKVIGTWEKELYHPGIDNVSGREWPQSQLCRVDLEKVDCFPVEKI